MRKLTYSYIVIALLFMVSCTSRKSANDVNIDDVDSIDVLDSMRPDMPPPPPPDSGSFDGHRPPPPDGMLAISVAKSDSPCPLAGTPFAVIADAIRCFAIFSCVIAVAILIIVPIVLFQCRR